MSQTNLKLTRGQIITEGIGRAGRPDLVSNARLWLNLFLENQYLNQDHEWLLKDVSGKTLIESDPLPSDYIRMKTMTVTANRIPIRLVEADEFEWLRAARGNDSLFSPDYGTPTFAYIDQTLNLIHFLPLPPTTSPILVYNYFYYFMPVLPEVTDGAHDSDVPVWGLSSDILIEEIYVRTLNWNDDLRYKEEKDNVKTLLNESKMNSRDLRAGSPKFKLGKSHVKRRF